MKNKKLLTIITLLVSLASFLAAFLIGKDSNSIHYDISMALLGSAVLGFIMSITEYFVEKRKAMEEFWLQSYRVLKELKKIKYLDVDAPVDLIINAFLEEKSNKWRSELNSNRPPLHDAKDKLISFYKSSIPIFLDENITDNKELEIELNNYYELKLIEYEDTFMKCINSYVVASSVDLSMLDNAYGNLDFICANNSIRNNAFDSIYNKLRSIVLDLKEQSFHFNLLIDGQGNFTVCAALVSKLNLKYYPATEKIDDGIKHTTASPDIFYDIDDSLEKFRCNIYGIKYEKPERVPIFYKRVACGNEEE